MKTLHPANTPHAASLDPRRRGLQHRLLALRAGLRAALRAFRTAKSTKR